MGYLNTKLEIVEYSKERSNLKLGGGTKHNNTRVRKLKLSSINNLIAYHSNEKQDLTVLFKLFKELEYRDFIKSLRLNVNIQ